MDSFFGNETAAAPKWHAESNVRGTFSILSSCIATLTLCVWSAIHINIVPDPDDVPELSVAERTELLVWDRIRRQCFLSIRNACYWIAPKQTWIKLGWVLLAVFAPELVSKQYGCTASSIFSLSWRRNLMYRAKKKMANAHG